MKKHLLTLCLFIISNFLHSQDITFIPSNYIGGYNVSCNGATDGTLRAILSGDGAPFTYQWSTGSYSSSITNIGAGIYTLTVTNTFGAQITNSFDMIQPNPLSAVAYVSDYNGPNVSENGGRDGEITIEATGGGAANNSTYLWSNGANERRINELQAGTYTVTITDPNQCTYTLSRTLIEPQLLQITGVTKSNYNGFNTSCNDIEDGWAEVTAIGGTTPYTYRWSNGSFRQRAEDLNAGNYAVEVVDANNIKAIAIVNITEPDKVEPNLNVTTYPNGYNISCFNCSNGAASLAITGGVSPFSIAWSTGSSTNSISGLNKGNYNVIITDANGCIDSKDFNITQPDREDWSMNGNTNSNPATQYMGTADSTDFVLKAKGTELIRLKANGKIKLNGFQSTNGGVIISNPDGTLRDIPLPANCIGDVAFPWQQSPYDYSDVFSCWRRFGIGTDNPQVRLEVKGGLSRFTSAYTSIDYIEIGHDGAIGGASGNAILNNKGNGNLLINYNNSKDVVFGGGTSNGKVITSGNTLLASNSGNVGIGFNDINNVNYRLSVNGEINASSYKLNGSDLTTLDKWELATNGTDLSTNQKVGVGTTNPDANLVVNGNVKLLADLNNPNNRFEFLSNNQIPYRRGISIGDDNSSLQDGSFNLWIHGGQNNPAGSASFNFKNSFDNSSIFTIKQDFKVGIRTENPREALQIGDRFVIHNGNNKVIGYNFYYDGDNRKLVDGFSSGLYFSDNGDVSIRNAGNGNAGDYINWNSSLLLKSTGEVSVNGSLTINSNANSPMKLFRIIDGASGEVNFQVNDDGSVYSRELTLMMTDFPDYVFDDDYKLFSIPELENYIGINKHLPNFPSIKSVELNECQVEVGEFQKTLLKQVEELTLYIIDLQKQINQLKNNEK